MTAHSDDDNYINVFTCFDNNCKIGRAAVEKFQFTVKRPSDCFQLYESPHHLRYMRAQFVLISLSMREVSCLPAEWVFVLHINVLSISLYIQIYLIFMLFIFVLWAFSQ